MRETMKAIVYDAAGKGSLRCIPVPVCGADEVLIRIQACSICKGAELGHATTGTGLAKYPVVPGHEFTGIVEAVGTSVTGCAVGDRVTADNTRPCGKCSYCRRGDFLHCKTFGSLGHNINGGFAEYVLVKENKVFPLDPRISVDEACMIETVACCIHAMDRLGVRYGERVVVIGDGPNGILMTELLTHSSAASVLLIGRHPEKLAIGARHGADTIRNDGEIDLVSAVFQRWPDGADAVVDATGNSGMIAKGLKMLRYGGRLMQYSVTGEGQTVEVDSLDFFARELTYFATSAQVFCFDRAIDAVAGEKVDLKELITAHYRLEDYFNAIERIKTDKSQIKIVIYPGGSE